SLAGSWVIEEDALADYVECERGPRAVGALRKALADRAQLLQPNAVLLAKKRHNPQVDDIPKRIDAAVGPMAELLRELWPKEVSFVPVAELSVREPGEPAHMLSAEGQDLGHITPIS